MPEYQSNLARKRLVILLVSTTIFTLLLGRFIQLQIFESDKFSEKAQSNSIRQIYLTAPRGIIYDRNGVPLVDNRPIFDLKITPISVFLSFDSEESDSFNFNLLSRYIDIPADSILKKVNSYKRRIARYRPQLIKRHIDFETMSKLEEHKLEFPGLIFSELPARIYPNQARLTHALGYLRTVTDQVLEKKSKQTKTDKPHNYQLGDVYGAAGIEKQYEYELRGIDGVIYHQVDIIGRDRGRSLIGETRHPEHGDSLNLTIEAELQIKAEAMMDTLRGVIIAADPENGDILCFVSSPDYDLESFVGPIPYDIWQKWNNDENRPLVNRAVNGGYPPGSIFKLVSAAAALELNCVNNDWKVECNGSYQFGNRTYRCWYEAGHGTMNMELAIEQSCNIYFYNLIQKMTLKDWSDISRRFGFGSKTGIDLPYEIAGIIPTKDYMNRKYSSRGWAWGNLLSFVIGQGDVLVTPIQIVQLMNIIATKGNTYRPHFKKYQNISDGKPFQVELKPTTWSFLQKAMKSAIYNEEGTGKKANITGTGIVRGKTGTAENPHGEAHSWFAGYIELSDQRKMSITVLVENGGHGSDVAAPLAGELFQLFYDQNTRIN